MFEAIDRTSETSLRDQVSAETLRNHTDEFAGLYRYPGTDDQWEAAEYIVDTLEEYGVDATMETLEAYTSVPESASVTVSTPKHREIDEAITTAFSASTPESGVSGEVVAVESLSDLGDVSGKIVLTRALPTPAAVRQLDGTGVAGVIFESVTPGHLHEMIVSPIWGTPSVDDVDELPDLPVVEVTDEDGEWLRERAAGGAVEVTIHAQTTTELTELPCPVGRVRGTESDRAFVVGNHIDGWHEGVTDNGTAIAATMELARVFADDPPKRDVVFGFWPGHSMGRYAGSAWYADENWLDLRENGVAYLHIDLNGLQGADEIWFQHMAEVEDEHRDVLETASLPLGSKGGEEDLLGGSDRPGRSSDQSFWGAGLSSLLSGARFSADHEDAGPVGGGWWWHTPEDTRDKVDMDLLVEETQLYAAIVSRFCNSPVLPHDFRNTCSDIRNTLEQIEEAAEGTVEFDPVYERLDALESNLEEVADYLDGVDPSASVDAAAEDLQVTLANQLIPALYMESPDYEHDPALPHELLPYLREATALPDRRGPERRFTETKVQRGVSKLAHRVERANETVESFLDSQA
jgi:hypothetical protein